MKALAAAFLGILLAAGLSATARADVIDGEWCTTDGRLHVTIRGPSIVTPGGKALDGDYTRHSFTYLSPEREPDAGAKIFMVLLNEETMRSRAGAAPTGETGDRMWNRCKRPVS
jgi:hypothetical protein